MLDWVRILAAAGMELTICSTCLENFELTDKVRVGKTGGMPGIFAALLEGEKSSACNNTEMKRRRRHDYV